MTTATTTIPTAFASTTPTVTASTARVPAIPLTARQNKTYLNKSIEDLSPKKLAERKSEATKWNRLSIVTTVAFFALAIGATIAVGLLVPAFTPFVALSAILLAIPVASKVVKFQARYSKAQYLVKACETLQRHYKNLMDQKTNRPVEFQNTLQELEVPQISGDLTPLLPLIAKAKYFKGQEAYFTNQKNQELNAVHQLSARDQLLAPRGRLDAEQAEKYYLALHFEDKALLCKLKNAFVNAVLRNREFRGNLEDVGTLSAMSPGTRALANRYEPNADLMFTFKNLSVRPITYNEVNTLSVAQLGSRMLAAMRT